MRQRERMRGLARVQMIGVRKRLVGRHVLAVAVSCEPEHILPGRVKTGPELVVLLRTTFIRGGRDVLRRFPCAADDFLYEINRLRAGCGGRFREHGAREIGAWKTEWMRCLPR